MPTPLYATSHLSSFRSGSGTFARHIALGSRRTSHATKTVAWGAEETAAHVQRPRSGHNSRRHSSCPHTHIARERFDIENAKRITRERAARAEIGIWSEYGIGDARERFWQAFSVRPAAAVQTTLAPEFRQFPHFLASSLPHVHPSRATSRAARRLRSGKRSSRPSSPPCRAMKASSPFSSPSS